MHRLSCWCWCWSWGGTAAEHGRSASAAEQRSGERRLLRGSQARSYVSECRELQRSGKIHRDLRVAARPRRKLACVRGAVEGGGSRSGQRAASRALRAAARREGGTPGSSSSSSRRAAAVLLLLSIARCWEPLDRREQHRAGHVLKPRGAPTGQARVQGGRALQADAHRNDRRRRRRGSVRGGFRAICIACSRRSSRRRHEHTAALWQKRRHSSCRSLAVNAGDIGRRALASLQQRLRQALDWR